MDSATHEPSRDTWNFLKYVLNLAVQLIKPNTGKYLTHFNGKSVPMMISDYEDILNSLSVPAEQNFKCTHTRSESFVPSFQEVWLFYQISMLHENR